MRTVLSKGYLATASSNSKLFNDTEIPEKNFLLNLIHANV